ncbi:YpsA SLOG family protein [Verrucomicrobiota bacterium]
MISKIVSGGQTGADVGGLDAAMYCGLPHGGWCPKGRRQEKGKVIPAKYQLTELPSRRSSSG